MIACLKYYNLSGVRFLFLKITSVDYEYKSKVTGSEIVFFKITFVDDECKSKVTSSEIFCKAHATPVNSQYKGLKRNR